MQMAEICLTIDRAMERAAISRPTARQKPDGRYAPFRVGPEPFWLSPEEEQQLTRLGPLLHRMYQAMDELYLLSLAGEAPGWLAEHLDAGKPEPLLELSRQRAFTKAVPFIIRPDLLLTLAGMRATELDSIPGSMGLLSFLQEAYAGLGFKAIGDPSVKQAFATALQALAPAGARIAIVVSDECEGYRQETEWLSRAWQADGMQIPTVRPEDLEYCSKGVYLQGERLDLVYRFFELFDLDNVPNSYQLLKLAAEEKVILTPPPKPQLEEKMWFAFLHHPDLAPYWLQLLGESDYASLRTLMPPTWLLTPDAAALAGGPLGSLSKLMSSSRKQRPFVLKPSGFSPLAWGGHGFSRGKDYTTKRWKNTLEEYIAGYRELPYVLQEYQHNRTFKMHFYDFGAAQESAFEGKVRLCPYYFVAGENITLAGALATVVPVSKPVIHGMTESVMVPAAVRP